jgi:hypothetical protein
MNVSGFLSHRVHKWLYPGDAKHHEALTNKAEIDALEPPALWQCFPYYLFFMTS